MIRNKDARSMVRYDIEHSTTKLNMIKIILLLNLFRKLYNDLDHDYNV